MIEVVSQDIERQDPHLRYLEFSAFFKSWLDEKRIVRRPVIDPPPTFQFGDKFITREPLDPSVMRSQAAGDRIIITRMEEDGSLGKWIFEDLENKFGRISYGQTRSLDGRLRFLKYGNFVHMGNYTPPSGAAEAEGVDVFAKFDSLKEGLLVATEVKSNLREALGRLFHRH